MKTRVFFMVAWLTSIGVMSAFSPDFSGLNLMPYRSEGSERECVILMTLGEVSVGGKGESVRYIGHSNRAHRPFENDAMTHLQALEVPDSLEAGLSPVPEPSISLLIVMSAFALMKRRR